MAIGDQDIKTFFSDGDEATLAGDGTKFMVNLDFPEDFTAPMGMRAPVVTATPAIRYETASVRKLASGDSLTIAGEKYIVRSSKKLDRLQSEALLREGEVTA